MSVKYEPEIYRRFAENLKPLLAGKNVKHADMDYLRKRSVEHGFKLKNGGYCWRSAVSSRMAQKTVMLGSEPVQLPKLNEGQVKIINESPDELHKVLHCLRTLPFVHIRRQMGNNPEFNPVCDMYMSVADPKNIRTPYCWANTMREWNKRSPGPNFTMIHIPDEHPLRMQVLSLPEMDLNIALGTDYTGEEKKGFLRRDPSKPRALEVLDYRDSDRAIDYGSVRAVPVVGQVAAGQRGEEARHRALDDGLRVEGLGVGAAACLPERQAGIVRQLRHARHHQRQLGRAQAAGGPEPRGAGGARPPPRGGRGRTAPC